MDGLEAAPHADRRAVVRELTKRRRDAPGLLRLAVQLTLLAGAGVATVLLAARGHALWMATVAVCGVALATLFPPLHEAGHGTAFGTRWMNEAMVWLGAALMLQAPSFFRAFHWAHHRETQRRDADPEIAAAPWLLDDWPRDPITYLVLASGQLLLVGKAMFTIGCALLPVGLTRVWERAFPFIRERQRRRIAWESRLVVALWAAFIFAGLRWVPGFWALLLAWPLAHVVLGFYLMPEHTGLGNDGDQLHITRSVESNAVVRWFMWNMPYHGAHHAHPAVPFHALPELHRALASDIKHVSRGYLAFHAEALLHALRLRRGSAR